MLLAGSQDSATNNLRSTGHDAVSLSTLNDTPTWQLVTVPPSRCIAGHARPLHAWLPDAMAGSTPISALIHAAAVVAAHGPAVLE